MREKILKFFGLGSAAIVTDFVVSTLLYYLFAWPLVVCGMVGFLAGAVVAYFIYLKVTFAERVLSFSWLGLYRFLKASFLAAIVRVVALSLLDWLSGFYGFVTLLLSICISSATRYLLARFYVFRKIAPPVTDDLLEQPPSDTVIR
ncbi:MAG TPA: GtrA family protein [Alphaproteobacteria bacterium]|nr:GtrA family protein [Alphaproteobacteria bacterium]HNS44334.1 GtrA family protein [Alphaproteobacteria bacterium]